jgi:GNAT superfamily N-acetyltransferase
VTAPVVRPLRESEIRTADHIFRVAFGTFIGLPDPMAFGRDADIIGSRWRTDPTSLLAAELAGEIVGSNCLINWGSVGLFGPLTVRPDLWNRGIAQRLLEPTMERFESWGSTHLGLFTFPNSPKHLGLYQKFGYWPRTLIAVMTKRLALTPSAPRWSRLSQVSPGDRSGWVRACREVTDSVYDGLDVEREITAVAAQAIGDTVLLQDEDRLAGFGVCHYGPGSEAETRDICLVKFGAVRGGAGAGERFERLLDTCEALAIDRGHAHLVACVNTGRHEAYRRLLARGFRVDFIGIAMHRSNAPAYDRPDVFVVDDWR